jgi:hypothetical protein
MTTGLFAGTGRVAMAMAAAGLALAAPIAAAQTSGSRPPITIPPAQIPSVQIPPAQSPPPPAPSGGEGAPAQPTMRALLPTSVQLLRDSQGTGIAMYGSLTAKATSAVAVLQGIFTYSQAFDPIPALPLVLGDDGDRRAQGLFTASVAGKPVTGIAVVALSDNGGDLTVFYDYTDSFAASFARLRQAFADSGTAGVTLAPLQLADGSRVGLPGGWRIIAQGAGLLDLMGNQGEFVSLGVATPVYARATGLAGYVVQGECCDPVEALRTIYPQLSANAQHMGSPQQQITQIVESQPAPAPGGGQSAFVLSNLSVGGRPYSYFAQVTATAGFTGPWTFTLSGVTAPQPIFAAEFPALLRIWQSHAPDPQAFADRLKEAMKGMSTTRRMAQSTTLARETADYNASGAWDEAIRGVKTGGAAQIGDQVAQALVAKLSDETGRPWHVVPASGMK